MIEIVPNWHPLLVHFTVALLAIATVLFVVARFAGRSGGIETAANWNLWIGAGITALTIAAGLQAAGSVAHDDAAHAAMENHKYWAFATATAFLLLAVWNGLRVRRGQPIGWAFVTVMVVAFIGLNGTGLRGADLVYRHGLGVQALPKVSGEGHSHDNGDGHSHDAPADDGGGHAPPASAAAAAPIVEPEFTPAEAEVVAVLRAYHDALTAGNATAPEAHVLADERFVMIEGKHINRGWADYRDNHLKPELGDLAKVRLRVTIYRVQMDGGLATASFLFNVLPKTGPEMDFGSGRASAVLVRTDAGWKLQQLHTS